MIFAHVLILSECFLAVASGFLKNARACLKKAFCKMCVTICGRFRPDEGAVAGYGNRIRVKYTAKWGVQIAGMIFHNTTLELKLISSSPSSPLQFRTDSVQHAIRQCHSFLFFALFPKPRRHGFGITRQSTCSVISGVMATIAPRQNASVHNISASALAGSLSPGEANKGSGHWTGSNPPESKAIAVKKFSGIIQTGIMATAYPGTR